MYYGRNAKQDELDYWSTKSDAELRPKLSVNSARELSKTSPQTGQGEASATTSTDTTSEEDAAALEKIHTFINEYKNADGTPMDESHKQILRYMVNEVYASSNKVYQERDIHELLLHATTNAEESINPYYKTQTSREVEDYKNKLADIRNQASRYTQQEQKSYADKLKSTKDSLRSRGLTFSGTSRYTL